MALLLALMCRHACEDCRLVVVDEDLRWRHLPLLNKSTGSILKKLTDILEAVSTFPIGVVCFFYFVSNISTVIRLFLDFQIKTDRWPDVQESFSQMLQNYATGKVKVFIYLTDFAKILCL